MNKKISFPIAIIIIVVCAGLVGVIAWQYRFIPGIKPSGPSPTPSGKINSFEECAAKGYPILESYPRQCKTPDGETFTEEILSKEQSCTNSGGVVTTSMCCKLIEDFPGFCLISVCDRTVKNKDGTIAKYRSCSPENSHEVKICDCGEDKCFNGERCVTLVAGTTVFCCASKRLDLNSDGVEELITFEGDRGASGNGPIFIYKEINGSWQQIGELGGNLVFIEEEKTDEYYDISTSWHLDAGSGEFCDYKWNESKQSYSQEICGVSEIGLDE